MRSIIVALIAFGALPFILARPYIGAYLWSWLSYMNPHRLAYGWAYHFPFAATIAGATLVGILFSKERQRIPVTGLTVLWMALITWMTITTFLALVPETAWTQWEKVIKIQIMAFVTLIVINNRERLQWLIWAITLSIGFFGVKGGIFSLATMGQYRVWGPPESFIADNNTLALALVMILPLWQYLRLATKQRWVQLATLGAMVVSVFAIIASYSRGAFLAIAAIALMLLWRSRGRALMLAFGVIMIPVVMQFMPEEYFERLGTIRTYEQDASAMGRINAWHFAWNLAGDRPIVGGGFDAFDPELFKHYAPNPLIYQDAHSIYFEILGEQGFVGLALFLGLFVATFRTAGWLRRTARGREELRWAYDLGSILQVSLVGYGVGGAFLGLAYFDLPYHLVAITVLARGFVERSLVTSAADGSATTDATAVPAHPRAAMERQ